MKVLSIGDIHGHNNWKPIVDHHFTEVDHIVFIGDYMDSFHLTSREIVDNFNEIVKFKKANKDMVTLLTGNHDLYYINSGARASGYKQSTNKMLKGKMIECVRDGTIQMAVALDNVLYTHAGVSYVWLNDNKLEVSSDASSIADQINKLFRQTMLDIDCPFAFVNDKYRHESLCYYGDNTFQGPVWIRPNSLLSHRVEGISQVVGHTHQEMVREEDGIFFIDAMPNDYLILEDGKRIKYC